MPDAVKPNPLARPLWRGRTNVDALTISCIERAERMGGHEFVVTQGSYQSSVAASAGTHDRGGAVDLRWCGHNACILALRKAGMAATWHRKPSQGPWPDHIHAVVYGHPDLAASAARQVESVLAGRNGLKSNGPDDGPRPDKFVKAAWPPESTKPKPKPPRAGVLKARLYMAAAKRVNDRVVRLLARSKDPVLVKLHAESVETSNRLARTRSKMPTK